MDKVSFGYPLTNEREYIIFILIPYLISKTNILFINIGLFIVLSIHIKKYIHNYKINKRIYKYKKEKIFYNLLLLISLLLFIKNNDNYLLFCILFITTGILFRKMSHNTYQHKTIKKNDDEIFISLLIFTMIMYPDYKYNFILLMEIIGHLLILRDKKYIK